MRVVLDVNVFVSGLIARNSNPGRIIEMWEEKRFELLISPPILEELTRVLQYPKIQQRYRLPEEFVSVFLESVGSQATFVNPLTSINIIKNDPSDNRYLECAKTGEASFIITGDRHLLELKEYHAIVILPPAGFVALLNMG